MNYLKLFGLAAVAATALMAFIGAGTASATVICRTEPTAGECPKEWDYQTGTKGKASLNAGTTAVLTTTTEEVLVTCTESTVEGTSDNTGSATTTVKSSLSTLTFSGCTHTIDTVSPGLGELHWIPGTNNGTLTTSGTKVTTQFAGVSCTYGIGTGTDMGTTVGGNPGNLKVNAPIKKVEGSFLCPSNTVFQAEYVATNPANAWVAER